MTGMFGEMGEACKAALIIIEEMLLLFALGPFLLHLLGLLLVSTLGAPLWVVAALLFGLQ